MLACSLIPCYAQEGYEPAPENLKARQEFADMKFGIFLHWGIYSMFGQGEWYMQNDNINRTEYAKVADAFYPHRFDAAAWVSSIKAAGAKYICITTRHHDGFSMWDTKQSDFNIVKATPYGKDVIKQLADECHKQGIKLHLYYSHLDWTREDYPWGRTGLNVGKDKSKINWKSYYTFMNNQLTELLTNYGKIGAIWFDGYWDHDSDPTPFDWELGPQYALIHKLQPGCLIGNNHHENVIPGEDIQIFERDLPGENTTGWVKGGVSKLPLETCETMNGMWGYKVNDQRYKSVEELITLLVKTSGKGANLLMNIGPQPNGELPAVALERLKGVGEWLQQYGETIYGTTAGHLPVQEWGATTQKGNTEYIHILNYKDATFTLPVETKVKTVKEFISGTPLKFKKNKDNTITIQLNPHEGVVDYVLAIN
ncbi:MAG: alpha-L-fucosidase [Bacteroidales bacterium]|nr:alpha-L-fucosidase [Bacteroidales bacterium]